MAHSATMRLFSALLIACIHYGTTGFTHSTQRRHFAPRFLAATINANNESDGNSPSLLNYGLLISSWTDGVVGNPKAQEFLKKSLALSLLSQQQKAAESSVESSAIVSPCCGPDTDALSQLETVDQTLTAIQHDEVINTDAIIDEWISQQRDALQLKLLYIPTAMYALRADSTNTPGKQRQRARADGKKRRTQVVELIQELFTSKVQVLTVTIDLDDASVKQPQGSDHPNDFPKDGRSALCEWSPNLIYVEGGNTFWLHHCMTKGDWQSDLRDAITNAVYCGKSAGAILAGRSVETASWKGWDDPSIVEGMETYADWKGVKGLDLVGGSSFFPHMSDEWEELVADKQQELGQVYCLRDEEICLVNGRQVSIVSADNVLASQ